MDDSLLVRLRSYRPREGRDSLEDFVTEAFCWLLRQSEEFSKYFLKEIIQRLSAKCQRDASPGIRSLGDPIFTGSKPRGHGRLVARCADALRTQDVV